MDKISIAFFVAMLLHLASGIVLEYTIENFVSGDDRVFSAKLTMETTTQPFIHIMDEAETIDYRYRYTTTEHDDFGHYVTSINDIHEDVNSQWYWAFTERTPTGDCFQNVGVSHYIPKDGEHLVFQYVHWDYQLPSCPD